MARTIEKIIMGVLIVAILGIGSILVTALTANKGQPDFVSSIQVADDKEAPEAQESVQLAKIAKISAEDAKTIALGAVDTKVVGEITDVTIENENGNVVYAVEFTKAGIETDVKIDAGNGKVLLIEDDYTEADQDSPDEED